MNTAPAANDVVTSAAVPPTVALARVVEPLAERDALSLTETLGPMFEYLDASAAEARLLTVRSEDDTGKMKRARVLRLELKNKRVDLDKRRKDLKSDILAKGKAIDAAFSLFEGLVKPLESHLLEQETFAERAVRARQDALRAARAEALTALGAALPAALGELSEDAWQLVLEDAKVAKDARETKAREEEEARVEAARILAEKRAETERQRKVAEEAKRLAAVGGHRREVLVALGAPPAIVDKDHAALTDEQWLALRAEAQRDADARREHEQAERERLAAAERAAKETAQAERDVAVDGQRKAEARADQERQVAQLATRPAVKAEAAGETDEDGFTDKAWLLAMAVGIRNAKLPTVRGEAARKIVERTRAYLQKLAADVEKHAEGMP